MLGRLGAVAGLVGAVADAAERLAADNSCRSPRIAPTLVDGRRTGAERLAEARAMREEAVRREKGRAEPPFRIPRDLLVYLGAGYKLLWS